MNYDRPTPETDAFMLHIDDSYIDLDQVKSKLKQLEAERDTARESCSWQTIETAPKDGTEILCIGGVYRGLPYPLKWHRRHPDDDMPWKSLITGERFYEYVPTHWIPIPLLPQGDE